MRKKLAIVMAVTLGLTVTAPTFAVNAAELPQDNEGVVQETADDTEQEEAEAFAFEDIRQDVDEEQAENMVELNESNFPDDVFRQYLKYTFDTDGDGWIDSDGVEDIDLSSFTKNADKKAQSLQGIEKFSNLRLLLCGHNNISALDLSKNTALTWVVCDYNNLSTLDVSDNIALTELWCDHNNLSTLDVSNNTELTELLCGNNNISTLDISNNTKLIQLSCDYNNLNTLDVSNNTELTILVCDHNNISTLDVSNNTKLIQLWCRYNNISTLDL